MMRLFIATPISDEVEAVLAKIISDLKNVGGPVKWVAPTNIHLTIKFLGETDEELVNNLSDIIDEISAKPTKLDFEINKLGCFPNLNRPRVIWAGLEGDLTELENLAARVDNAVHELGWGKEERRFKAHLTLGRIKSPEGMRELTEFLKTYKLQPINLKFDRLVLFNSTLTPRGPTYEELHKCPFKTV